jgi:ribosomal protein S10
VPRTSEELQEYGIDWDGPAPLVTDDETETVTIEPPRNPLNNEDWRVLERQFRDQLYPDEETVENNIMSQDFSYGFDIYFEVRQWIKSRLETYNREIE